MIRNQWYAVLESKELKSKPIGTTRLGERMVFWRDSAGKAVCFFDRCAHRGASLALGACLEGRIQCPFHGLEYDPSGRCVLIPANGRNQPVPESFRVRAYPTHEAYGIIWIWWGFDPPAELAPPEFFDDLRDLRTWASVQDPWDTHYSKVMENQLDVAHLPFVHHNSIGRDNATLVEGPGLEWKGDKQFFMYPYNKQDDGSKPRRPDEVPVPPKDTEFKIELILPNLWENHISERVRILALFVPVDDKHTIMYLRFYQTFIRMPLLRGLICRMAMPMNRYIAGQDRRVVNTQLPKGDGIGTGELLFPGDHPIMEFRKKRIELKKRAGMTPS
ncbi:MAG TPA: aromatic ring-hydroxylating dioxygenase subunit alpha [Spirochaetia bacterium]|nr:aromatic ring-hydroxylating dioxygenase subunit alpha [Spirochaetia bacterium]